MAGIAGKSGGARTGSGRKKRVQIKQILAEGEVAVIGNKTPLEYALDVMNDPTQDELRRDRMAVAAMPFVHLKKGEGGKKEQSADSAEKAQKGKFSPTAPPKLVVNNK